MTAVRNVPLGQLHLEYGGFKNPRTITGLDDDSMKEFAVDLRQNGIIIRPEVVRVKADNPEGFVTVVWDGQRRVMGGLRAFGPKHEIEVIDLGPKIYDFSDPKVVDEIEDRAIAVALERKELSSFELLEHAIRKRARGKKLSDIAAVIHRSETWVSRMLKAHDSSTPVLRLKWQNGEVTDEQFKDLAAEKDGQDEKAEKLAELRQSGDKAGARAAAKEMAESAKQKRLRLKQEKTDADAAAREAKKQAREDAKAAREAAKKGKGKGKQLGLAGVASEIEKKAPPPAKPEPKKPDPKKPSMMSRAAIDDMIGLASKRPPTHDYVKGVLDGLRFVTGAADADQFAKPWKAYLDRLAGVANVKNAKKIPKAKQVTVKKSRKASGKRKR